MCMDLHQYSGEERERMRQEKEKRRREAEERSTERFEMVSLAICPRPVFNCCPSLHVGIV